MESYRIIVSGKVQHVYYRKFVTQALQKLAVRGYIQNLTDGTVEIVARIYDDDYAVAMEILQNGSPLSQVVDMSITILDGDDTLYDGFEIRS